MSSKIEIGTGLHTMIQRDHKFIIDDLLAQDGMMDLKLSSNIKIFIIKYIFLFYEIFLSFLNILKSEFLRNN